MQWKINSRDDWVSATTAILTVAVVVVFIAFPRIYYADLIEADGGFGLVDYIVSITHAKVLDIGLAGGLESYGTTISMRLARLVTIGLGMEPLLIQRVLYLLEPICLVTAGFVLIRFAVPEKGRIFSSLFLIMFVASTLRNSSFGTWPSPFYAGSFYVFAEAVGSVAVCALISKRFVVAGVLFAVSLAFHISIGIGFLAFGAGVAIYQLISGAVPFRALLAAAVSFMLPAGSWLLLTLDLSAVSGGSIPDDLWRQLVFAGSYHTFPIQAGMFGLRHQTYFTGFLAFILLLSVYLARYWAAFPWAREFVAGSIAVSLIVGAGLIISVVDASPFLIKLHLHRLNSMILLFGSPIVVYGLWNDLRFGSLGLVALAALTIVMPFYLDHGVAAIPALLIAVAHTFYMVKERRFAAGAICALSITVFLAVFVIYAHFGYLRSFSEPMYSGWTNSIMPLIFIGICITSAVGWRIMPVYRDIGPAVFLVAVAALAVNLQLAMWPLAGGNLRRAEDFYQVQLWAHEQTEPHTLFLVDPTHSYGWRGYSERPTLGSLREWLYTNIVYSSDKKELSRGLDLAADFGIDMERYLSFDEPLSGYYYALFHMREKYCKFDRDWFAHMAVKYGVSYFVFDKSFCSSPPDLNIIVENSGYYVGAL